MNLLDLYKAILESAGCSIDDQGLVSYGTTSDKSACFIEGRRLRLPTSDLLDHPDWETMIAFHPLSESNIRGESVIIKNLRLMMNTHISHVVCELMLGLMGIAADISGHKKLRPECLAFLKQVPVANEKTIKMLGKIFCNITLDGERRVAGIYLKRGGKLNDVNYRRLAAVFFPIAKSIDDEEKEIFGVKLTTAEKSAISNLFYYVLPESNVLDKYSYGSNSDTAPYFHALCGAYINVIKQLNTVAIMFKKHIPDGETLITDIAWEDHFYNLGSYSSQIPPLPFNEGDLLDSAKGTAADKPASHVSHLNNQFSAASNAISRPAEVVYSPTVQEQPAQVQQGAAVEERDDGKISFSSIVQSNPMLQPNMGMMNNGWPGNPGMMHNPAPPPGEYAGYHRGAPVYNGGYQQQQPSYPAAYANNPVYRTSTL